MSKDLFQQYREEELRTMVTVPYQLFKEQLKPNAEVYFIKHFYHNNRDEFKKSSKWTGLEDQIKKLKKEQKDVESEIRVK